MNGDQKKKVRQKKCCVYGCILNQEIEKQKNIISLMPVNNNNNNTDIFDDKVQSQFNDIKTR